MSWTKGFKATDCEGHDVVSLLREAIKRRNVSHNTTFYTFYSDGEKNDKSAGTCAVHQVFYTQLGTFTLLSHVLHACPYKPTCARVSVHVRTLPAVGPINNIYVKYVCVCLHPYHFCLFL